MYIYTFQRSAEAVGNGMIRAISQMNGIGGVKLTQYMGRKVYQIGQKRYDRCVAANEPGEKKKSGGRRSTAVSADMIQQIARMLTPETEGDHDLSHLIIYPTLSHNVIIVTVTLTDGLPLEVGFACAHGKIQKYPTEANTMIDVFKFYEKYEPKKRIRKMAYKTFLQYLAATQPNFHIRRQQKDVCDVCERIRIELTSESLSKEEREQIEQELAGHQNKARTQRRAVKEFVKVALCGAESVPPTDETIAAVVARLPDEYDSTEVGPSPSIAVTPLKKVRLLLEDFAGNFPIPSHGKREPGSEYYLSKLAQYAFISSDIGENSNILLMYDQRAGGKGCNAMLSLRLFLELKNLEKHRSAGTLSDRPQELISVRDNCVGQNKSQAVLRFCALLEALGMYRHIVICFLTKGHSHMQPDRVTAWCKRTLRGEQLYSGPELVSKMNTCGSVEATYLDYTNDAVTLPLWDTWEDVLDKSGIFRIPAIPNGGYTQYAVYEFGQGRMSMRLTYDSEVAHEVPMYATGTKSVVAAKALQLLFGAGKTLDNVTARDVILPRHPEMPLSEAQVKSIGQKKHFIPPEYHHHYPGMMLEPLKKDAVEEQKVDSDGTGAPKTKKTLSKGKTSKPIGPVTLQGRASVLDWIVKGRRSVMEMELALLPGMKQRAIAAVNVHVRQRLLENVADFPWIGETNSGALASASDMGAVKSAPKGVGSAMGQPLSDAQGLASASDMGAVKSAPKGVGSAMGQPLSDAQGLASASDMGAVKSAPKGVGSAMGQPLSGALGLASRVERVRLVLAAEAAARTLKTGGKPVAVDLCSDDDDVVIVTNGPAVNKRIAKRSPKLPTGLHQTYHGDCEAITFPWWCDSCPMDAYFPTLYDPYSQAFQRRPDNRDKFHSDFPVLCGTWFPQLLDRRISFRDFKNNELYRKGHHTHR